MNTRKYSKRSENNVAKSYGGKRIAGSGSGRKKGDVMFGNYNIDDKTFINQRKSFSLNIIKFDKHYKDCQAQGEVGLMRVAFDKKNAVIVLKEADFQELLIKAGVIE